MTETSREFMLRDLDEQCERTYALGDKELSWEFACIIMGLWVDKSIEEILAALAADVERLSQESGDLSDIIRAKQEAAEYLSTFLIRTSGER